VERRRIPGADVRVQGRAQYYLKSAGATQGSLEALIAWNKAHAKEAMPIFDQEIFEKRRPWAR
jgi:hypothetical protein